MNGKNDSNLGNKIVFSQNLRHYLTQSGKLQKDIAVAAKVSQGTISDWLQARSYPRMDKLQLVAKCLDIEMSDLVEEHVFDDEYRTTAKELANDPDIVTMFQNFQKLSPEHREMVKTLINSLAGGNNE